MPIAIAAIVYGFVLLVYAIVLFVPQVLNDGDTWMHIAVGRWILQHRGVPWTDPFSFTFAGKPWEAHEWLSELAMAIAYRLGGLSLVLVLTGVAAALAAALLARHLRFWLDPVPAVLALMLGFCCVVPSLLVRPHILALPALELWAAGLLIARTRNRAPALWLLPVMTLWANLHGSFAFGLALVLPLGLEAVLADRAACWRTGRAWGLFFVAATVAALLTPYGWHGLVFPFQILRLRHLSDIGEWHSIDFSKPSPLEIALMATLYVCLSRGVRIPPVRLLIMLGLLHMALQHQRHQMLAGIVGALLLAEPLAHALRPQPVRGEAAARRARLVVPVWAAGLFAVLTELRLAHALRPRPARGEAAARRARLVVPVWAAGLFAVLTASRLTHVAVLSDRATSPVSALQHVPPGLKTQPVFNDYACGGLLIFDGIRPFIDGRAELYGDVFLGLYEHMQSEDPAALEATFQRYGIIWTILAPTNPAVAVLDALPGWRRAYSDRFAVVHIRTEPVR